jgi:hypothetical protein
VVLEAERGVPLLLRFGHLVDRLLALRALALHRPSLARLSSTARAALAAASEALVARILETPVVTILLVVPVL